MTTAEPTIADLSQNLSQNALAGAWCFPADRRPFLATFFPAGPNTEFDAGDAEHL